MYVAIDTSHQMRMTGMISSRYFVFTGFYTKMEKIFRDNYVNPPFHWSKISRKVKGKTIDEIVNLINQSDIKINILTHKKPLNISKKDYFHTRLPKILAEHLEPWLKFKGGHLCIDVDDDYTINKFNTTINFLESFITQIGFRLVGKHLKIIKKGDYSKGATLKQDNGEILEIIGKVARATESIGVQAIDIIMGIYNEKSAKIDFDKLHIRNI